MEHFYLNYNVQSVSPETDSFYSIKDRCEFVFDQCDQHKKKWGERRRWKTKLLKAKLPHLPNLSAFTIPGSLPVTLGRLHYPNIRHSLLNNLGVSWRRKNSNRDTLAAAGFEPTTSRLATERARDWATRVGHNTSILSVIDVSCYFYLVIMSFKDIWRATVAVVIKKMWKKLKWSQTWLSKVAPSLAYFLDISVCWHRIMSSPEIGKSL